MPRPPRLIAQPCQVLTIVVTPEDVGWRLSVREVPPGGDPVKCLPDVYEQLSIEEVEQVVAAVLCGVEHPGATGG